MKPDDVTYEMACAVQEAVGSGIIDWLDWDMDSLAEIIAASVNVVAEHGIEENENAS